MGVFRLGWVGCVQPEEPITAKKTIDTITTKTDDLITIFFIVFLELIKTPI